MRASLASPFQVIFQPNDRPGMGSQVLQVHPDTAAILEHATRQVTPCSGYDHAQAAFLSNPPDIGWFAAQSCFFEIA
jgi:hypothetical protein